MYRKINIYGRRNRTQVGARFLLVMGLVCLLFMLGMIAAPTTTRADGIPGGNVSDPSVRAVDIAKPAVVRIITFMNGHLTVHFSATQNVTFPQSGGTSNGYGLAALGTGTFISAHGDILTADHVVRPPQGQELTTVLIKAAAPDVTAYYNQHIKPGNPVTADQMTQLLSNNQIPSDATFDQPLSRAYLSTDYTGPLTATQLRDVPPQVYAPVDRIEQESAVNQSDVAIIHVNMSDTASVQLGDSSAVQQQDNLTIIGFPGNGDVSNNATDLLTSSINRIFVSSMKTTDTGSQVIQVGGNVEQGDSGGPALDSQGRVVGIVSFGAPGGTSFLQASNSARQLVQAQHLDTTPGAFQVAWHQAFNDYAATAPGHWHKAQQEFASLATRYATFKAIMPYLNYAQTQAQHEQAPSKQPSTNQSAAATTIPWPLIGAGVAILAILLLLLFGMSMLRGRRKARVVASGAVGSPTFPVVGSFVTARPPSMQHPPAPSPQRVSVPHYQEDMSAFGAPPASGQPSQPPAYGMGGPSSFSGPVPSINSGPLRPWPCGHMNRASARYCSICGEPNPPPLVRPLDQ